MVLEWFYILMMIHAYAMANDFLKSINSIVFNALNQSDHNNSSTVYTLKIKCYKKKT